MIGAEERRIVYLGLLIACAVIAVAAGPLAGVWSFVQVGVMIELGNWLTARRGGITRRRL